MERLKQLGLAFVLLFPHVCSAIPYYGATVSYAAVAKEPPYLHGYQFMLTFDPDCYQWRRFNLFFDAGFSHFWITNTPYYTTLNIYSAAPVIRYSFKKRGLFQPYLDLSIGVAYLNHTRLDDRNLGIHFAFQDRIGVGTYLDEGKHFSLGIHAVHYSNAHLSANNSGISIPVSVDISYRFG